MCLVCERGRLLAAAEGSDMHEGSIPTMAGRGVDGLGKQLLPGGGNDGGAAGGGGGHGEDMSEQSMLEMMMV